MATRAKFRPMQYRWNQAVKSNQVPIAILTHSFKETRSTTQHPLKPADSLHNMPVPFEAFIPMGLVVVMFGITGTGFNIAKRMTNDGKVC